MTVTKAEAAEALAAVRRSESAMRSAFRAYHGHYCLWLWGVLWIAMAMLAQFRGIAGIRLFPWISLGGGIASFAIGFYQANQVRFPVDRRFFGALTAVLGFSILWPFLFRPASPSPHLIFTYIGLVVAHLYILAGLWFDSYMVWLGAILAVLLLVGFIWVTSAFWIWIAVCCGGTLLLTGFYVRYFWR